MRSIHINDQLYTKAQQLATARGFKSVDAFIAEVVEEESRVEVESYDHLFTPEVMAAIAEGVADGDAGRVHSIDDVRKHFAEKSKEWRRNHAV
jgi:predicted transcriptional regulator